MKSNKFKESSEGSDSAKHSEESTSLDSTVKKQIDDTEEEAMNLVDLNTDSFERVNFSIFETENDQAVYDCEYEHGMEKEEFKMNEMKIDVYPMKAFQVIDPVRDIRVDLLKMFCPPSVKVFVSSNLELVAGASGLSFNEDEIVIVNEAQDATMIYTLLHEIGHVCQKYDSQFDYLSHIGGILDFVSIVNSLTIVTSILEFERMPDLNIVDLIKILTPFQKRILEAKNREEYDRIMLEVLETEIWKEFTNSPSPQPSPARGEEQMNQILIKDLLNFARWIKERDADKRTLLFMRKIKREIGIDLFKTTYMVGGMGVRDMYGMEEISEIVSEEDKKNFAEGIERSEQFLRNFDVFDTSPTRSVRKHLKRIECDPRKLRQIGRVRIRGREEWNDFGIEK